MKLPRIIDPWRGAPALDSPHVDAATVGTILPANFCSTNDLTQIEGFVGNAARVGCYGGDAFGEQQDLAVDDRTNGLYVLSPLFQRGLSYHKVGVINRNNGTNAVCHVPTRHGNLRVGASITCSGTVAGTYHSYDDLFSMDLALR